MAMTFWGNSRFSSKTHPHEAPPTMTIPLAILAVLSIVGGWIGIPHVITHTFHVNIPNVLEEFLSPRLTPIPGATAGNALAEWGLMGVSVALAGLSASLAYYLYVLQPKVLEEITSKIKFAHQLVYNKYFVDEAYDLFIVGPLIRFSKLLWAKFDVLVIDRATYVVSDLILEGGRGLRGLQNGNLQQYALFMVAGLVLILLLL